jgi:neural Wiskott-Aldrich syndrome protein
MPSILNEEDKETVKRVVPKQSNKIQAVAVARLYVAYPNRAKWTYTGLQGAIVLANDLVGNTYWVKMVDISVSIWKLILISTPIRSGSRSALCVHN